MVAKSVTSFSTASCANARPPSLAVPAIASCAAARLSRSIDQIALTFDFKSKPKPEDIFDAQYLPAKDQRGVAK